MTTIKALAGLALMLACSPAMAQTALQQLGQAAGADVAPIVSRMEMTRAQQAVQGPLGVARFPKDVFEACSVLEAKPFTAWNVKQAAVLIQTCLNHSYSADGSTYYVSARVARFSVPACPAETGALSCQALIEVEGIAITVSGSLMTGNPVLGDLNYALQKRGGKLLGFDAALDNKAVIRL
ncbi:MAG: hypothetical protein PHS14_06625 [Elusimicrobia bacterium]|nr:hypothetical protein [Elusimicrobiota bacterium]